MMKFSKDQAAYVLGERKQHDALHANMAQQYGNNLLVGNASPLPKDVWGMWDTEGKMIQRDVLAVYNNLAGSVSFNMQVGKLVHHFQTVSDSGSVNTSLDGESNARVDQQTVAYHGTPLPIIDTTHGYTWRQVLAAQTEGVQLDSAGAMNAIRKVSERLEDIMINGDSNIVVGDAQLYGLLNHPKRGTRATGVALNGATGAQWETEFKETLKVLHAANYRVDVTAYVNWDDWFYATATDYSTAYAGGRISDKILGMSGVAEVVPASRIPANTIVLVVKRRDSVQLLNGMPVTTIPLARLNPQDRYNFKTMAAAALEIKFDAEDQCGIAVSS